MERKKAERIESIFSLWEKDICPGGVVCVQKNGKIIFEKAFGYANIEWKIKNSIDTVFHVASISKQVICLAVLLLDEREELSIEKDIRDYIPELINSELAFPITIRDLMNNVSGLRDQWELLEYQGVRIYDIIENEDALKLIGRQKQLNFEPEAQYMYCNSGFTLLSQIVKKVSGKSASEFIRDNIFVPLGMYDSVFKDEFYQLVNNKAYSYIDMGCGKYAFVQPNYSTNGPTALSTTVHDFLKWIDNLYHPKICSEKTIEKMLTVPQLKSDKVTKYACGIFNDTFKGRRCIHHSGADAGYRSMMLCIPEEELNIVIFANTQNITVEHYSRIIADICLDTGDGNVPMPVRQELICCEELPGSIEGIYYGDNNQRAEILKDGQGNYYMISRWEKVQLTACGKDCYRTGYFDGIVYFNKDGFIHDQGIWSSSYKRVKSGYSDKEILKELLGTYYSEEIDTLYHVYLENEELYLEHTRNGRFKCYEIDRYKYVCFLKQVTFISFEKAYNDCSTRMILNGGRAKNIVLDKRDLKNSDWRERNEV